MIGTLLKACTDNSLLAVFFAVSKKCLSGEIDIVFAILEQSVGIAFRWIRKMFL